MSTHDPKDGLTDAQYKWLNGAGISVKWRLWVMSLVKENAALKAERDNASGTLSNLNIDVGYNHADGCECVACKVGFTAP